MRRTFTLVPGLALLILCCSTANAAGVSLGEFTTTATVLELVGEQSTGYFENVLAADHEIEWTMYVPDSYSPTSPPGLMVYVSPGDSGEIPRGWKSVLDEHNLIWIAANHSGNRVDGGLRISYAILAPIMASRSYSIDKNRVYVSGLSGGGRVASIIAPEYAHIFKGGIFNCGVNFWGKHPPKRLEQVQENRYVFVTGSDDFNRRETRKVFNSYKKAGAEHVRLMDIADMGHENPSSEKFSEAIAFLDRQD